MGIAICLSELAWNAGVYVPKLDTEGNWDAHYDKHANSLGFNVEYIDMNRLQSHHPSTLAFWLDSSHKIKDDIRLNGRRLGAIEGQWKPQS
ncbi:MAG: hypothetical protein SPG03_01865 [Veillonella caviae]|uniref:hypothetical protein n=1 Tax=Veillonella caviae TaxID=248316 RepID=UPI002A91924F|nr:hypothetical protein [Veillonella caviae]MDY5481124.1 hypothetical protein [Veillonella caviae]